MRSAVRRAVIVAGAALVVSGYAAGTAMAGAPPVLAFSPASHDYQQVTVGQTASQVFTLKNTGGSATSALKVMLPPGPFSITANTCSGTSLGPGKSCTVTVQFAPTATGPAGPVLLTAMSNKPAAMATASLSGTGTPAGHLFWTNIADANFDPSTGSIVMANLDGTNQTTLVSGQDLPWGLAVDGTNIYWENNDGTVNECSLPACSTVTVLFAGPSQSAPNGEGGGVAVAGGNLYWANSGTNGTDGTVNECSLPACSTVTQLVSGQSQPGGVAVNGSNIYWANNTVPGTINECPLTTCSNITVTQLVTGQNFPWGVAVDGNNIYWSTAPGNGGAVWDCPLTNCNNTTATQLAGNTPAEPFAQLGGIAVNGSTLYWASFGLSMLDQCSLPACSTVTSPVSDSAYGPWGVAVSPN